MVRLKKVVMIGLLLSANVLGAQGGLAPLARSQPASIGPTLTYQSAKRIVVAGDSADDSSYLTPKGAGYDGVGSIFIERTDGSFLCSGALFAGGAYMLTAAHCLADDRGNLVTTRTTSFFFTPETPGSTRESIESTEFFVHPEYTGEIIDAHDIAVIKLGSPVSAGVRAAAYQLYSGNPFGAVGELVGSGARGTGETGSTTSGGFALSDRRRGSNLVDFGWTDPGFEGFFDGFFGSADPTGLVADFDNGLFDNDASCQIALGVFGLPQFCDQGLGDDEAIIGPGDSGGPLFINGRIAGVASYGLSFGPSYGDIDGKLNDSFGEFSGWASTGYNDEFLNRFVTPEPSAITLVAAGLAVLAFGARRRRSS